MAIRFIPTEVQTMLRDGLRRWGADRDVRKSGDCAQTWQFAAGQGWLMAGLPEQLGGLGGDAYDMAVIAEEFGRALVRAPFVEVMVAATVLASLAPDRVAAIACGQSRPLLAHDEPEARGDHDWVTVTALAEGGDWLLTGRKSGIVGAGHADSLLVTARMAGGGTGLFEVETADAPLQIYGTFDDRTGGDLRLRRSPAIMLATPGATAPVLCAALDLRLILESAEMLGAVERAQEMTRDYLLTRKQYGHLIGDFQALRHRLAEMFIETEQARSIILRGLGVLVDGDPAARALMAAAVKARVAQAALFVCGNAIQLHGGIGVTDEYPVGHFYKRALAFDQRHGGSARQVERFAELSA
ncbi:MAG: acyl-CoA dehydrogenase protein [Pseudomonadota bacterium]